MEVRYLFLMWARSAQHDAARTKVQLNKGEFKVLEKDIMLT